MEFFREKRLSGMILAAAGILIALRLMFPVMHVSIDVLGSTLEICTSHFYPLLDGCLRDIDQLQGGNTFKAMVRNAYRPDFDRTLFEAFGVAIFSLIAIFMVNAAVARDGE
jgi:hypothetical protein